MALEGDGPDEIQKSGKWLRHVHIAEKTGRCARVLTGDNFRGYFYDDYVKNIDFKGRISLECNWKNQSLELPLAVRSLREQWNSSG